MAGEIEFDWDEENTAHLRTHRVSPQEFEQVIENDPVDLEYRVENGEERYKSIGVTDKLRALIIVWTLREGRLHAVTAYSAGKSYERLYWETKK